eukprot:4122579-Pleurochrysis_carterae.AAC.1
MANRHMLCLTLRLCAVARRSPIRPHLRRQTQTARLAPPHTQGRLVWPIRRRRKPLSQWQACQCTTFSCLRCPTRSRWPSPRR